ncbi:MAG: sulfatase [Planctomycetota bacterium]
MHNVIARYVCVLLVPLLINVSSSVSTQAAGQPNFIIIFTDDQGYNDLGCFGGTHVNTPQIDRMAAEGAKLTNFYVAAPVCTPSRAALLTGCYPRRIDMATGSKHAVLLAGDSKGLNPQEITIAEVLKLAGYKTGIFGKWHLGDQPDFLPTRQGFDEFFGLPYSHDIHPFHPNQKKHNFPPLPLLDGENVVELDPDADYLTKRITERAVKFIEENKDGPFFLYVPHPIPHRPLHASPPFMTGATASIKEKLAHEGDRVDYQARDKLYKQAIEEIDWSVGQILDALKSQGIDDNTLVIFTSDNGPKVGSAHPLIGGKGSSFEGGVRVSTVVRWPGKVPADQANDELMTTMDLLPTFMELAGSEIPDDRTIDGKNISQVLFGRAKSPHDALFYHKGHLLVAVRSGPWKLHLDKGKPTALYHLENDIGETTNLVKEHRELVKNLLGYASAFEADLAVNSRPAAYVKNPKPLTVD